MVNYASIRYRGSNTASTPEYLEYTNEDIADALGMAHQIRVGGEFKPIPALSVRVGYNYLTYGQKNWLEEWTGKSWITKPLTAQEKAALSKTNVSFGAGYAFGSFFLDAAVRFRFMPKEYLVPYHYYDYNTYTDKFIDTGELTPEIEMKSTMADIILTAGWRF